MRVGERGADIHGSKYYGIVVNAAEVDVDGATIHDIGDNPVGVSSLRGMQRGVGVLYTTLDQANEVKYQSGIRRTSRLAQPRPDTSRTASSRTTRRTEWWSAVPTSP